ncbi:MAG TPA: hypothetical protein VF517_18480 [Thermoleophilaceae bacterium]|jgi:hypothetical protein
MTNRRMTQSGPERPADGPSGGDEGAAGEARQVTPGTTLWLLAMAGERIGCEPAAEAHPSAEPPLGARPPLLRGLGRRLAEVAALEGLLVRWRRL